MRRRKEEEEDSLTITLLIAFNVENLCTLLLLIFKKKKGLLTFPPSPVWLNFPPICHILQPPRGRSWLGRSLFSQSHTPSLARPLSLAMRPSNQ